MRAGIAYDDQTRVVPTCFGNVPPGLSTIFSPFQYPCKIGWTCQKHDVYFAEKHYQAVLAEEKRSRPTTFFQLFCMFLNSNIFFSNLNYLIYHK